MERKEKTVRVLVQETECGIMVTGIIVGYPRSTFPLYMYYKRRWMESNGLGVGVRLCVYVL